MFEFLTNLFGYPEKKIEEKEPPIIEKEATAFVITPEVAPLKVVVPSSTWRVGMWVVNASTNDIGVIASFDKGTVVFHKVDRVSGETVGMEFIPFDGIRQAKYNEIPSCRMSVSRNVAKELGYGD